MSKGIKNLLLITVFALIPISLILPLSLSSAEKTNALSKPFLCATKMKYDGRDQLLSAVDAMAKTSNMAEFTHNNFRVLYRGSKSFAEGLVVPLSEAADYYFSSKALRNLLPNRSEITFTLAILNEQDWKDLRIEETYNESFGSPFATGSHNQLIVMSENGAGVFSDYLLPFTDTPKLRQELAKVGMTFDQARYKFTELVAYHELGHIIGTCLGLVEQGQHRWFGELAFTYLGTNFFLQTNREKDFGVWNSIMENAIEVFNNVQYRDVKSHDDLVEAGLPPDNFFWFHSQFNRRGIELQKVHGDKYLKEAAEFFAQNKHLPAPDFMTALEARFPGFVAWTEDMAKP